MNVAPGSRKCKANREKKLYTLTLNYNYKHCGKAFRVDFDRTIRENVWIIMLYCDYQKKSFSDHLKFCMGHSANYHETIFEMCAASNQSIWKQTASASVRCSQKWELPAETLASTVGCKFTMPKFFFTFQLPGMPQLFVLLYCLNNERCILFHPLTCHEVTIIEKSFRFFDLLLCCDFSLNCTSP